MFITASWQGWARQPNYKLVGPSDTQPQRHGLGTCKGGARLERVRFAPRCTGLVDGRESGTGRQSAAAFDARE